MSVKVMGRVWDLNLPPDEKFLLLALADEANHDGKNAHPGVGTLAKKVNTSERTVQRLLVKLKAKNLITARKMMTGGRGWYTVYDLTLEKGDSGVTLSEQLKGDTAVTDTEPERVTALSPFPDAPPEIKGDSQNLKGDRIELKGDNQGIAYKEGPVLVPVLDPVLEEPTLEASVGADAPPAVPPKNIHPAIKAIQRVTNRYPERVLYEKIILLLGDSFDEARMSECFVSWVGRGFNRQNFAWLFEWYVTGIPPTVQSHSPPAPEDFGGLGRFSQTRNTANNAKVASNWINKKKGGDR